MWYVCVCLINLNIYCTTQYVIRVSGITQILNSSSEGISLQMYQRTDTDVEISFHQVKSHEYLFRFLWVQNF